MLQGRKLHTRFEKLYEKYESKIILLDEARELSEHTVPLMFNFSSETTFENSINSASISNLGVPPFCIL